MFSFFIQSRSYFTAVITLSKLIYKGFGSNYYSNKMVFVKLQKRKSGNGDYFSTVITIPNALIESLPSFKNAKDVELLVYKESILIKAKN